MDTVLDYKAIGIRIHTARKLSGMTQAKLCEKAGLSESHLSHIENGTTKLSLPLIVSLANALNTTVDAFLYDHLTAAQEAFDKEFKDLLSDCDLRERGIIYRIARETKNGLKE